MIIKEITNKLLKELFKRALEFDLDFEIFDIEKESIQIQINVKPKHFKDFAFFYDTKEEYIHYSSIFELETVDETKINELYKLDNGIFNFLIIDNDMVHLQGDVDVEYFIKNIEDIVDYLCVDHEITKYLQDNEK